MTVTLYKNYAETTNGIHISLEVALKRIKEGGNKGSIIEAIQELRLLVDSDAPMEARKAVKLNLPLVLFGGSFNQRKAEGLIDYSGLLIIDFDHINTAAYKERLKKDNYIYACWLSPSGDGLKALVKVPNNKDKHKEFFFAFMDRYPEIDASGSDVSRMCFESYDPDIYVNENSFVWDRTVTEEQRDSIRKKIKKNKRFLDIAVSMVLNAPKGTLHDTRLKAGNLVGGYIKGGAIEEDYATRILVEAAQKNTTNPALAKSDIEAGIAYGKTRPLFEAKRIEKTLQFVQRADGTYDFLADEEEMDDYETRVLNGTLEMGLPTMLPMLDRYFLFKKHNVVWFIGRDNVGKSFLVWYLAVLAAMYHGWKFAVYSKENGDGQVRKKLKEFYLGKPLKECNELELAKGQAFIKDNFRLFTSKQMHTVEDFIIKAELIHDTGFRFEGIIAEPYNSFDYTGNPHESNIKSLNLLQTFSKNYAAVWVCDHITSTASREKGDDGRLPTPRKQDVDGGQMKANKVDDFVVIDRDVKSDVGDWSTEIHVDKIKDRETGGRPSPRTEPAILILNRNMCGYTCNGFDPVREFWGSKQPVYKEPKEETKSGVFTPAYQSSEENGLF